MLGNKIVKWVMMASNIVAVVFMLMILLGSVLSPEKFILPSYFALGFPVILIINIGFVIFWLLARKWFFLLSLSILLFSSTEISNEFPVHLGKTETVKPTHPIHILTYNMMMSGKLVKHTKKKPNKVIQYILDANADIVCLQEFFISTNDQYITHSDMLRIFRNYPYKQITYKLNENSKSMGIATFSKYPIINKQQINYQSVANLSIYSDIRIKGQTIRVINNHLESNRITENDKAMPIKLKDNFDAESLTGITLHFSHKLGAAYRLRANQADIVAKVIQDSPHKVIVCGDFNDVPGSYAYTKVKGNLADAFAETGTGFGWTFYGRYYGFRIDYVFYDSSEFAPVEYKTDKVKYSDHYPVLCQLRMKSVTNED
ncbi:MAG: endonuclease/exonuclease/phosphatase family protein [Paludibacter sp.]|nr:endonuclease/exonuclease/phosphatase family protein [Paludibacter sp.]